MWERSCSAGKKGMGSMSNTERQNRILVCPLCGKGKLTADKSATTSESGFIYRTRHCDECGRDVYTKQPPEEFTGPFDQLSPHMRNIFLP